MIQKIKRIHRQSQIIANFHKVPSKPIFQLYYDLLLWALWNRGQVLNFFVLGLYQKGKNISEYLTFRSLKPFYNDFYPIRYISILEDKLVFEKFMNNYPTFAPKNLGYISRRKLFFYNTEPQPIENIENYSLNSIIKSVNGFGGKDVFKLFVENGILTINGEESSVPALIDRLPRMAVIQQVLDQHETIKKLHPASLNTARVITVNTGSKLIVVCAFLRVGMGNSVVDNISRGGIYVPVDKESGKLGHYAYSDNEPMFYYSHPQTNVAFDGLQIPFYQQALQLCKDLHHNLPYFFLIGWDVAFTPTGPVIIEANNIHTVAHAQITEGGLKRDFEGYIREFLEQNRLN